jgi:hypothetical protein
MDYDVEDAEEEGDIVEVEGSEEEVDGGIQMRRLADESSSGDQEMEEYDDESS